MSFLKPRTLILMLLTILAVGYPFWVRSYYLSLGVEVLIFAIFAMSLNLLLGYTGLVSFGHAAFFGLGGYIAAFTAIHLTPNLLVSVPLVIVGTALAALLIGALAIRTSGIYFLMITLAFAQMLYSIAIRWSSITGGSDGIAGIPRPVIGIGPWVYGFDGRTSYYYLTLVFFVFTGWVLWRLMASPFGWILRGVRENEARMLALGYNTFRYKVAAFVIAGVFAAMAGLLLTHFFWHAAPEQLYWTTSGEAIIMVIIGGSGTLPGPFLGAALVRLLPNFVSSLTARWQTIQGIVFIAFVLFAPQGIVGLMRDGFYYWANRRTGADTNGSRLEGE